MLRYVFMLTIALSAWAGAAAAEPQKLLVAVASNFLDTAQELMPLFAAEYPYQIEFTSGSTGKLYAQIAAGAPFAVLLAADQATPARLVDQGLAEGATQFTYAYGRLTLWSPDPHGIAPDGAIWLSRGAFDHLAIANPDLAPYGVAAMQTLRALGLADTLKGKIVTGENIAQAFALTATGNAQAGLVALSLVQSARNAHPGSRWDVPETLYDPIRQDAVLLKAGADDPVAKEFLVFLQSPAAQALIAGAGYGIDSPTD